MAQPPSTTPSQPMIRLVCANHGAIVGRWGEAGRLLDRLGVRSEIIKALPPGFDPDLIERAAVETINDERSVLVISPAIDKRRGPLFSERTHPSLMEFLAILKSRARLAFVGAEDEDTSQLPESLRGAPVFVLADRRSIEAMADWARSATSADSPRPDVTSSAAPPSPDSLPLSSLFSFSLSPGALAVFERAKAMTPPGGRWATLTTLAFLFAFKELGRETPQNEDTVHFIHRYIDREAASAYQTLYETTVRTWIEDSPPDLGTDQPPGSWVQTITPNVMRLFERAKQISIATFHVEVTPSGRTVHTLRSVDAIHARHLFAALLTFVPAPGTPNNVVSKLASLGIDLAALKSALFEVIAANTPEENTDAWREVLGLAAAQVQSPQAPQAPSTAQAAAAPPRAGPVESLERYQFAQTARPVIDLARRLAATLDAQRAGPDGPAITSLALLFALAEVGERADGDAAAQRFRRHLMHKSADPYYRARHHYFPRHHLALGGNEPPDISAVRRVSPEAIAVLDEAQRIARLTNLSMLGQDGGDPTIHPAHLAAALATTAVSSPPPPHRELLDGIGLSPLELARALAADVRLGGVFTRVAGWRTALAPLLGLGVEEILPEAFRIAFENDQNRTDHLNLKHEINALAYLIAARKVEPPLAIGLFGEWGSGKSFFMSRLRDRVNQLAEAARRADEDAARCRARGEPAAVDPARIQWHRNICQIEFNAWHYVEGNIWASLVENIFSNLQAALIDPDAEDKERIRQQEALKQQLGFAQQARADLQARLITLDAARAEARRKVDDARHEHTVSSNALARQLAKDIWADVAFTDAENPGQIRQALVDAGFPETALDTPRELYDVLQSIRTTGGWFRAQFAMLTAHGEHAGWRSWIRSQAFWVFIGATLIALALAVVLWLLKTGALAGVVAVVTQLTGLIGAVVVWLTRQAGRMNRLQRTAEPIFKSIENKLARAAEEKQRNIAMLEKDAEQRSAVFLQAQTQLDQVEQDISKLRAQIDAQETEPDATKVLAQFIEERAACTDYRRHLGITALIRRDFEKLAELIASRGIPSKAAPQPGSPRSVDRIVLYIDDLDRCPPDKVVAVLEAIHLILAFKLFVVVVGVDARWISHSLKKKYGSLLAGRGAADGLRRPAGARIFGDAAVTPAAVPEDYLEKIFQVPFRLRPLSSTGTRALLEYLTRSPAAAQPAGRNAETESSATAAVTVSPAASAPPLIEPKASPKAAPVPVASAPSAAAGSAMTGDSGRAPSLAPPPADPRSARAVPNIQLERPGTPPPASPAASPTPEPRSRPEVDLAPGVLELTKDEISFMQKLAPVIGRSPRAVHRFVNCYRLLKAARDPLALADFERAPSDSGIAPCEAAMLLLGLVIGVPEIAPTALSALMARSPEDELSDLIDGWDQDPRITVEPDWKQRIEPFLRRYAQDKGKPCPIEPFRRAALAVARYSFRTGMLDELQPGPVA